MTQHTSAVAETVFNLPWPGVGDLFLLRPDVTFLNHGSFGATPRPVFERYQAWQRELEGALQASQPYLDLPFQRLPSCSVGDERLDGHAAVAFAQPTP